MAGTNLIASAWEAIMNELAGLVLNWEALLQLKYKSSDISRTSGYIADIRSDLVRWPRRPMDEADFPSCFLIYCLSNFSCT